MQISGYLQNLGMDFHHARSHHHHECEALSLARRRVSAAVAVLGAARERLIAAIPDGAGQEHARFAPWKTLAYDRDGWHVMPGERILSAAHEVIDLARILGEPVTIANVNEGTLYAEPGDTFGGVAKFYRESGGIALEED